MLNGGVKVVVMRCLGGGCDGFCGCSFLGKEEVDGVCGVGWGGVRDGWPIESGEMGVGCYLLASSKATSTREAPERHQRGWLFGVDFQCFMIIFRRND